jgi:hypothetical protein
MPPYNAQSNNVLPEGETQVVRNRKRQRDMNPVRCLASPETTTITSTATRNLPVDEESTPRTPKRRIISLPSHCSFERSVAVTPETSPQKPTLDFSSEEVSENKNIQVPSHSDLYGDDNDCGFAMYRLQKQQGAKFRRRCSVTKFSLQAARKTLSVYEAAQKALDLIQDDTQGGLN